MAIKKDRPTMLVGNIQDSIGEITTDIGKQRVVIKGAIGFRVFWGEKGVESLNLIRLNLTTKSIKTKNGFTGAIGLKLADQEVTTKFDVDNGSTTTDFRSVLHYSLIDDLIGYREIKKIKGDTHFVPYFDTVKGTLKGHISGGLKNGTDESGHITLTVDLATENSTLHALKELYSTIYFLAKLVRKPASILKVQPVFIGTDRNDNNATGISWPALAHHATNLWNRCGSERCIAFKFLRPLYKNQEQYRVISNQSELEALSRLTRVDNAIEIFFADKFTRKYAVNTGGGATFSAGVENARIVTCDQQLDVPCPPPCDSEDLGRGCGEVNYYHLAHEMGHVLGLCHPSDECPPGLRPSTVDSVMEPSGFCADNPNFQSAMNCRNAENPLFNWESGREHTAVCLGSPDIDD